MHAHQGLQNNDDKEEEKIQLDYHKLKFLQHVINFFFLLNF